MSTWIKRILIPLFVTVEITILVLHLVLPNSILTHGRHLLFLSIIFAFSFALVFINKKRSLINLGLLFTVCADFFLVPCFIINGAEFQEQIPGMICFSLVQLTYAAYLFAIENKNHKVPHIIVRAVMSVIGVVLPFIVLAGKADFLTCITGFYLANFVVNIVFAFMNFRKNPLLAIGLVLFLLCDINTGLNAAVLDGYFVANEGTLLAWFGDPTIDLTWIFYLPAQILIALSVIPSIKAIYIK